MLQSSSSSSSYAALYLPRGGDFSQGETGRPVRRSSALWRAHLPAYSVLLAGYLLMGELPDGLPNFPQVSAKSLSARSHPRARVKSCVSTVRRLVPIHADVVVPSFRITANVHASPIFHAVGSILDLARVCLLEYPCQTKRFGLGLRQSRSSSGRVGCQRTWGRLHGTP